MSFLQMSFLPATGVAAVLSMGAFDWDDDPVTVKHSFWIFIVFAVAMTALVLGIYFGRKRYKKIKRNQEEQEAKEREDRQNEELMRPPMDDGYSSEGAGYGQVDSRRKKRSKSRRKIKPETD